MDREWECVVIGAGAAGLSAALVLGRARRETLVIDSGRPSNASAAGIGGLLGHDGRPPADFYAHGRGELEGYPSVVTRKGEVVGGHGDEAGFVLELEDGSRVSTRRVLLATGMDYRHPRVPGIAERWGGAVFHCPFCHGWEHRDGRLGVLDRGATGTQRALMLRLWSDDVTLFADGPSDLETADAERLRAAGVTVDERAVAGLDGPGGALTGVVFADGSSRPCDGLLVPVTLHQRSQLAARLGAALAEPGMVVHDAIQVGSDHATTVPGLYAAGDASAEMPSVPAAIAAGHRAAAMIVHGLMGQGVARAPVAAGAQARR
ncbi:MAG: Thioredoxin reductase [uncultured Solirubrobacteraceae bacterium]|uniref:Thioredoxin reductase n=1 Tax=uncultured Solirubrobacteraceae bacterium TaxID=1162706 RepID=A0A6J4RCY5_9ACTN|nr:MAG: Thioredoxin reductase [uncultured Solirubrobacteraceae bacterium]